MIRYPIATEFDEDPDIDLLDAQADRLYAAARRDRKSADEIAGRVFDLPQQGDRLMEALSLIAAGRDADAMAVLRDLVDAAVVKLAEDKISNAREFA